METTRLGRKGQVSIPKIVLDRLGLEPETVFLVEAASDGSIILRPAGIYPLEVYTDSRVNEFLAEDELTDEERQRLETSMKKDD